MNQFDNIAHYSSQGGTSRFTGKTTKPDITAPGGSSWAVPLFSADSNYNDAKGGFPEIQTNDSAPMVGTSMATPIIAGCAQVVIQAMGGYANWSWSRSQAVQPKMVLLMTATETYPSLREMWDSSMSPTLDRGGKDVHEGYGRVNLDAAVDALQKTCQIGTVVTGTLGSPPTLNNISVLGQSLAWARNVQLVSGVKYDFSLNVPVGADCDLYLYNGTGTSWGDPVIVAKSTNATTGGTEQFLVAAPYTGTYYVVVKRATETTGSGTFTLSVNVVPLCALKTRTGGSFYVPNASFVNTTALRVEMLFDNANLTGDQTGGTSPYPAIANYPDGKVSGMDIAFVNSKFGSWEGETSPIVWDYMADVNPDRRITNLDVALVCRNFGLNGSYIYDLSGVIIAFNTGDNETPDANGFVAIPQSATSFNVTRNGTSIGAMIIFCGP
jgi:hypothetical protein